MANPIDNASLEMVVSPDLIQLLSDKRDLMVGYASDLSASMDILEAAMDALDLLEATENGA